MFTIARTHQTKRASDKGPSFKAEVRLHDPKGGKAVSLNGNIMAVVCLPLEAFSKAENFREDKDGRPFVTFVAPDLAIPQPDGSIVTLKVNCVNVYAKSVQA